MGSNMSLEVERIVEALAAKVAFVFLVWVMVASVPV